MIKFWVIVSVMAYNWFMLVTLMLACHYGQVMCKDYGSNSSETTGLMYDEWGDIGIDSDAHDVLMTTIRVLDLKIQKRISNNQRKLGKIFKLLRKMETHMKQCSALILGTGL